mgnify:CR=1 FL=1
MTNGPSHRATPVVLHCITGLEVGGAEWMLCRYLRALGSEARRHRVLSLMRPGPLAREIESFGVAVDSLGLRRGAVGSGAILRLRRSIAAARPDILQGWMYHGNLAASVGGAIAARRAPVIWGVHHSIDDIGNEPAMTRRVIRLSALLSRRVAAIAYCARISAEQHARLGFSGERATVLQNGVDVSEFRPRPGARDRLRALCGFPAESFVLGHVARAHPMKDASALVRATAALRARGVPAHAVLIGAGHPDGPARAEAVALGVSDHVTALGARSDVPELLSGFDVFVLCSAWGEAFSLALTEALASGVPTVATDVGDSAEIVGADGAVVPARDLDSLVRAIEALAALTREERVAIGLSGRRRMTEELSLERYVERMTELHRTVLSPPPD